jgi:hypothetical protein
MQGRAAPSLAKAANAVVDGPALDATTATAGGASLVRRSLSALALPPVSRVAGRCPLPFRPSRGAEAEAPLG